ncbi:MAG: hypothetical protein KF712_01105 [Akkermansiaceae bacterium]|nr:hypothetical protein [Akkermansiaceae bacterium]
METPFPVSRWTTSGAAAASSMNAAIPSATDSDGADIGTAEYGAPSICRPSNSPQRVASSV